MRLSVRFFSSSMLVLGLTAAGLCQTNESAATPITAGYGDATPVDITQTQPSQTTVGSNVVFDATTGLIENAAGGLGPGPNSSARAVRGDVSTIDGIDSLATFDGAFLNQAGPSVGKTFRFSMVGNHPLVGGTTNIPANIDEVSLQLLNADGSVFANVPFAPFESLTLQSPNFNSVNYRSGNQIQYADAIHRAQFFNHMAPNWHTTLVPNVINRTTFVIPQSVRVRLSNGNVVTATAYFTRTASDGSTVVFMLNLLFNFLFQNEVVNQINAGTFTTDGMSITLFPNTYLFSLGPDPTKRGPCCVLGFHTYFFDSSVFPQPRWITQYASWISPGIFRGGFQDVTALSHETSEIYADPFLDNATAKWQFPGVPANDFQDCQANLEEGDPIEVLPTATIPIPIKEKGQVFAYHPQIIPLLQWFEMGTSSSAIDGAFSFPDESTLPHSALPCPPPPPQ